MKKPITTVLLLFLVINGAKAQWDKKFKASLYGGYEHNIFLSPNTLVRDGEQLFAEDLLTSGFFEGISLSGDFEKKFEDGRWKLGFATSGANFHTNPNANKYTLNLKASYRKKYKKGRYLEIAPSLARRSQNGINESDGVLRTTFSYTRFNLPAHLDFYLGDKKWFKTETGYTFKGYDKNDLGEKVSYHAVYTRFRYSKKWQKDLTTSKLIFSGGLEYRHYTDLEAEEEEGVEEEEENETVNRPNNPIVFIAEERQWFFYRASLEYNVEKSNTPWEYTFGIYYVGRGDSEGRFGYNEVSPGLSFQYKTNKFTLTGSAKYSFRKFATLEVGDQASLLRYNYVRTNLRLSVPLGKKRFWYVKGDLTNRVSNRSENTSTAFRGYFNSMIETGITIRF